MYDMPSEPAILLSWLNMKLRDEFSTPDDLCRALDIDREEFNEYIAAREISYFPEGHRFVME